jgi:hypothetical protein
MTIGQKKKDASAFRCTTYKDNGQMQIITNIKSIELGQQQQQKGVTLFNYQVNEVP